MEATFEYPTFLSYAVGSFSGGHRDAFFLWSHVQRLSLPDFEDKYLNGEYLRSMEEDKHIVLELLSESGHSVPPLIRCRKVDQRKCASECLQVLFESA
jgi:hypothetical protein